MGHSGIATNANARNRARVRGGLGRRSWPGRVRIIMDRVQCPREWFQCSSSANCQTVQSQAAAGKPRVRFRKLPDGRPWRAPGQAPDPRPAKGPAAPKATPPNSRRIHRQARIARANNPIRHGGLESPPGEHQTNDWHCADDQRDRSNRKLPSKHGQTGQGPQIRDQSHSHRFSNHSPSSL